MSKDKLTPKEEEELAKKRLKALEKARKAKLVKAELEAKARRDLAEQRSRDAEKRLPKLSEQYEKQTEAIRKIEARNTKTFTDQEAKAWDKLASIGNQIRGTIAVIRNADREPTDSST